MIPFLRFRNTGYPWPLFLLILLVCATSLLMLYSAGGGWRPWALKQMTYMSLGAAVFSVASYVDMRFWLAYASFIFWSVFALLLGVEILGVIGMGARRWIDLYAFNLQPSELMKLALVLLVAAHFHYRGERMPTLRVLLWPFVATVISVLLVLRQPDLGTALILLGTSLSMCFAIGMWWGLFASGGLLFLVSLPVAWNFLRSYQKKRIFTFLDPSSDPMGSGYHLLQSKIAVGSGGLWGKGFMKGTQVQLDFLPEKQTDFIFTLLCEEWGLIGALLLITFYALVLIYGYLVALRCNALFTRLTVVGVMSIFFCHVFTNIGMVLGALPIVGIPLPFMSYGGTSLLTFMIGFGWVAAAAAQSQNRLPFEGWQQG